MINRETVVNLISHTKTEKGLKVQSVLDENQYLTGKKVTKKILKSLNIHTDKFHPEWNYTISPK